MHQKIKVLRVVSNLGIGGVQRQLLSVLSKIDNSRFDVDICAVRRGGILEAKFAKRASSVYILGIETKYSLRALMKLVALIKRNRYDIVHIHRMDDIVPVCTLAAHISNVDNILIQHHFPYHWKSRRKLFMEKVLTKSCNRIIGVSHHVINHTGKMLGIPANRRTVIYNGIEANRYAKSHHQKHVQDSNSIGLVARIVYFKRIGDFIKAAKIVSDVRRDVKFSVIGSGEKDRETALRNQATALGVDINWMGEIANIEDVLFQLGIGVLCSSKEGLGNVILEYMASGLPIVSSKIPPVEEILPHGKAGLLVPPKSPSHLASALLKTLDNKILKRKFSLAGPKRVKGFRLTEQSKLLNICIANLLNIETSFSIDNAL